MKDLSKFDLTKVENCLQLAGIVEMGDELEVSWFEHTPKEAKSAFKEALRSRGLGTVAKLTGHSHTLVVEYIFGGQ